MLDWDDLRYFLAAARHGSLTAAAEKLGVASSTMGRRLAALETTLGVRLLNRTPGGYVLTMAGEEVRAKAEHLEEETRCLQRSVGNQDEQLAGPVRVTCPDAIASYVIAPCLPRLHDQFPGIEVDLVPTSRPVSLAMRETDIAVRLGAPEQGDVVGRRLGVMAFRAYASTRYVACRGTPDFSGGCDGHRAIALHGDVLGAETSEWFGDITEKATTVLKTCSHEAAMSAASQDGGIACLACFRAAGETGLMELETPTLPADADVWLVLHKDNRHTARMRATADHIAERVKGLVPSL